MSEPTGVHQNLSASPVQPGDRISAIDITRGIALFGVMGVNLATEFRVSLFQQFLPQSPASSLLDRFADAFVTDVLYMKAWSLFSMLFGIGLAIQFERLSRTGRPILWLARRLLVLLALGLTHLYLIWDGDILAVYAIVGLVVLPFLLAPNWLVGVAAVVCLAFYVAMPLINTHIPSPTNDWIGEHVARADAIYRHGNFAAVLRFNIEDVANIVPLHLFVFPRTVGLFLLGALSWRLRLWRDAHAHKIAITLIAIVGLWAGIALPAVKGASTGPASQLAPFVLAIGYGATIVWLVEFSPARSVLSVFGPLGRMAFSNYIAQSIVFSWVFFGYGFGLYGHIGTAATLAIGTAVYILQILASSWWLRRYQYGPLEWLWRTLMYGKSQSMIANRI